MIRIDLTLDEKMCLSRLEVEGHAAKNVQGTSVPCAAVSALVGTAARLIESNGLVHQNGSAGRDGSLRLNISRIEDDGISWMRGITDFLVLGLKGVENEYPRDCIFTMNIQED